MKNKMKPVSVIVLILVFVTDIIFGTEYLDCTSFFKNRVALFEYKYYPGYWSYPSSEYLYLGYNKNTEDAKSNTLYHWTLHDCGKSDNSTLCIESNSEDYKGNWIKKVEKTTCSTRNSGHYGAGCSYTTEIYPILVEHHNFNDVSQNPRFWYKIFCTKCSTDENFQDCEIRNVDGYRLYTKKTGFHKFKGAIQESWFSWRIIAPETKMYWKPQTINNCKGTDDLLSTIKLNQSITNTVTTTNSVAQKVNVGTEAIKLLNKLESETSYTWTKAKTTQFAEGKEVTLKKLVKPGWKWVVSQLIGTVSFLEISTDEYKSTDVQCST